ncbi:Scaffold-type E3 ligase [Recurvomyces mirabilis]|uniref:Defective in cullin neddylation protein n=1 Tax=Recurvomyces mirabilis TaxID=574656 RepID=A0AAE1C6M8_9PEZI|nr:Scaffold-type E3 ligase [Recurvomyces mirabilis]KAK5162182.1 Scaffold-type E3 ligase [Recurvomyces mirabilis]
MPSSYTSQQKTAISEFTGVTQADKSSAAKLLKQFHWNVPSAVNAYFNNPSSSNAAPNRKALNAIFDTYRDDPRNEPDQINVEGSGNLLGAIDIPLDDVGALVLFEIVRSTSLGVITREGFLEGLGQANADSLPKIKTLVLQHRSALPTDPTIFKNVYVQTFILALTPNAKTVPLETAIEFWRMIFVSPSFAWRTPSSPWLDWWLEFLEEKKTKAVNRDLWKQTLNFANETMKDESLGFWNEESSWPSVIDEFVGWVKEEKRSGADAMQVE